MRRLKLAPILCTLLSPGVAAGQNQPRTPVAAVHVGAGNAYGGLGVIGEYLVLDGRLGGFVGVGILPPSGQSFPKNTAAAVGLRYYVGGAKHRAFAEVSTVVLALAQPVSPPGQATEFRDYGPGFSLGYSFVSPMGLTVTSGAGLGASDFDGVVAIAHLGVGWTWRRARD